MASRGFPSREDLVDFTQAVAGHAGALCDTDGFFFIKPCTQPEIDFYETARAHHPEFTDLMPLYVGSLMLNQASDVASEITHELPAILDPSNLQAQKVLAELQQPLGASNPDIQASASASMTSASNDGESWTPRGGQCILTDRGVVLENVTYGYQKPNVLDVKLGQRLWADDAPRQKRVRMDEVRATTTHDKMGFRISGMRVFQGSAGASEPEGSDYKIYSKDFGRYDVNDDNVVDAFRKFIFNKAAGIDEDLGRAVANVFKQDLERVRRVMEKERTRIYSSSLLFVFEGDGAALRQAIAANEEASAGTSSSSSRREDRRKEDGKPGDRSASRTDSGIVIAYDDLEIDIESNIALDDDDDEEEEPTPPAICGLRLIDFAHAQFCPEEDRPDENVLVGVRNLIRIFDELSK
ncbi:arginine metabolism regulation protein 3 [Grosmannia clavigera kw1407]|uniref:Kinase n=1 Tax=Grosmannia clavigera (strain kw1407 / UAMH 11150) TaxID=655863 RepID=F0X8B6_GROCL|nr:arginine metabolism regulation protein 3 [Grosmannia clavigera kw1407]EFX05869.1 arginine metabolism regulation protein 3 [Grosmannia clavigera kw1407]